MDLKDDLYIIPIDGGNIIYSPLRRGVFWANEKAADIVRQYITNGQLDSSKNNRVYDHLNILSSANVVAPTRRTKPVGNSLVVILSQQCNLACAYCYAHEARSKDVLGKDKLKIAYNSMLANENKHKKVSFIGGGEPMVTWDAIEWSVNYINQHKSLEDKISYSITTNATLLTDHIIWFCKNNRIHIGVSFEIIKDVQDNQRPFYKSNKSTFDVINQNIKKLIDNGISFEIRSTITKLNVTLMPEMVSFVADNYSVLKKVHFEQVTDPNQNNSEFYSEFIDYFFKAREIGKSRGIDVYNSITKSVYRIRERFCNGEMCITPTGDIVACHRVSSAKDIDYSTFCYGRIEEESMYLDSNKYQSYLAFANTKKPECERCFAYWHCAGICPMERTVLKDGRLNAKCNFTKEIVKRVLLEAIINSNNNIG